MAKKTTTEARREALEKTEWAKFFKRTSPTLYNATIRIALIDGMQVQVYHTRQHTSNSGEGVWVAATVANAVKNIPDDFWMAIEMSKAKVEAVCKEFGWGIVNQTKKRRK